jgi:hypothetical protein
MARLQGNQCAGQGRPASALHSVYLDRKGNLLLHREPEATGPSASCHFSVNGKMGDHAYEQLLGWCTAVGLELRLGARESLESTSKTEW